MSKKLQKIGTITILEEEYDVAKNGSFRLVKLDQGDCYGKPIAEPVELVDLLVHGEDALQALLDALGEKMVALQAQRDMRRGEAE